MARTRCPHPCDFEHDGETFWVKLKNRFYKRWNSNVLYELLQQEIWDAKRDRPNEFYIAQLLHYGLAVPRVRARAALEGKLRAAFDERGSLELPQWIFRLENALAAAKIIPVVYPAHDVLPMKHHLSTPSFEFDCASPSPSSSKRHRMKDASGTRPYKRQATGREDDGASRPDHLQVSDVYTEPLDITSMEFHITGGVQHKEVSERSKIVLSWRMLSENISTLNQRPQIISFMDKETIHGLGWAGIFEYRTQRTLVPDVLPLAAPGFRLIKYDQDLTLSNSNIPARITSKSDICGSSYTHDAPHESMPIPILLKSNIYTLITIHYKASLTALSFSLFSELLKNSSAVVDELVIPSTP